MTKEPRRGGGEKQEDRPTRYDTETMTDEEVREQSHPGGMPKARPRPEHVAGDTYGGGTGLEEK